MRRILVVVLAAALAATGFAVYPYQLEEVAERIVANSTGCTVDVQNYSGWAHGRTPFGLPAERVADPIDAYAFVDGCPGAPDGRPAALALASEGKSDPGEACGVGLKTDHVCRVRIPTAPGRYRLLIQPRASDKPQSVEIEVLRVRTWRSGGFDALMSV